MYQKEKRNKESENGLYASSVQTPEKGGAIQEEEKNRDSDKREKKNTGCQGRRAESSKEALKD